MTLVGGGGGYFLNECIGNDCGSSHSSFCEFPCLQT